ncbi:hypothetical protein NLI96_g10130 [Meripilus lineatus]|uniref:rRNA adenine N(6)-methyltransferase n=1 Tax=Meripilus lineatus TaxID=2056292 RepID=A0AAD5Y9K4_9APHY|nr:hypothetical protein NLI96_g10130 [Physisporinus lineatus]
MPPAPSILRSLALTSRRIPKVEIHRCLRLYSVESVNIPPLPPDDEWKAVFPHLPVPVRDRVSVRDPVTADRMAASFVAGKSIAAGDNKIIIESFPGPGALSRALLKLPESKIKKLIILEDWKTYLEHLQPLEADPRVTVVPLSGFDWDTYSIIEERGLLNDVETVPWDGGGAFSVRVLVAVMGSLGLTCCSAPTTPLHQHIPHSIKGEQLIAQLFRCIPEKSWLFKYGRVPMSFILGDWIWERTTAKKGTQSRCKVSVIAEASAKLQNSVPPASLRPYEEHFHPLRNLTIVQQNRPESRRVGHPYVSVNVLPYEEQVIERDMLEKWDFVLRRLFVLKGTPLKRAISSIAPGANVMLKSLTDPALPKNERVDCTQKVRDLTIAEWALVMRAFDNWPFAPQDLMIGDHFLRDDRRY